MQTEISKFLAELDKLNSLAKAIKSGKPSKDDSAKEYRKALRAAKDDDKSTAFSLVIKNKQGKKVRAFRGLNFKEAIKKRVEFYQTIVSGLKVECSMIVEFNKGEIGNEDDKQGSDKQDK